VLKKDFTYVIVLTHDVDQLLLRNYSFLSREFLNFLKYLLLSNLIRLFKGRIKFMAYVNSILTLASLQFVKIRILLDPWENAIKKLAKIEMRFGVRSTFFFIPIGGMPGYDANGEPAHSSRIARYNLANHKNLLDWLSRNGFEIGVHGLNAHIGLKFARDELNRLKQLLSSSNEIGIRIHWLYQREEMYKIFERAGFFYDATMGYNDKINLTNDTSKPFKYPGSNLWVLPLHIQDSTLLGEWRMNLSPKEAFEKIRSLLQVAKSLNAIVTISWHTEHFFAPRYWGRLYIRVLEYAKKDGAKFLRAIDAIKLFADENRI